MISASLLLGCLEHSNRFSRDRYIPLFCAQVRIGWMLPSLIDALRKYPDVFIVDGQGIHLNPELATCTERSTAIAGVVRDIGHRPGFGRWNDEYGAITTAWGDEPLMLLPRCATKPFGVRSYGSHVNGFLRSEDRVHYWVARRSAANSDYGGYLDTLAGGRG